VANGSPLWLERSSHASRIRRCRIAALSPMARAPNGDVALSRTSRDLNGLGEPPAKCNRTSSVHHPAHNHREAIPSPPTTYRVTCGNIHHL